MTSEVRGLIRKYYTASKYGLNIKGYKGKDIKYIHVVFNIDL